MIKVMATVRITEAELARDVHAVLAKVKQGVEVIVEQNHRPVATIRTPPSKGRLLSESIALAEARGTTAFPDEGFMRDVEEGIADRSEPWNPPTWG
jgi:antitoxin (DNA-binding transcriptional repressor) of toxin-antitoxin stability system